MSFSFFCYGHPNILAEHKNTLEFTKDKDISLRADCIVGVNADYDIDELLKFIDSKDKLGCSMLVGDDVFEFSFELNQNFNDLKEMVIRKSNFISNRTLGIYATKAAVDIPRNIVEIIKDPKYKIEVVFDEEKTTEK